MGTGQPSSPQSQGPGATPVGARRPRTGKRAGSRRGRGAVKGRGGAGGRYGGGAGLPVPPRPPPHFSRPPLTASPSPQNSRAPNPAPGAQRHSVPTSPAGPEPQHLHPGSERPAHARWLHRRQPRPAPARTPSCPASRRGGHVDSERAGRGARHLPAVVTPEEFSLAPPPAVSSCAEAVSRSPCPGPSSTPQPFTEPGRL